MQRNFMKMKNKLISVIIPAFNVEKYLSQCIDSIRFQTYDNLDILIIDDGSTDKTGTICDEYRKIDSRIRVIHQDNRGIAYCRNLGVKESKGDYIFWIDSDDYVSNKILEELYNLINKYSADMAICDFIQGSKRDYKFELTKNTIQIFDSRDGLNNIYNSSHDSFIMNASWGKLINKNCYRDLKYPDGLLFEDIYMSHHLINNCKKIVYTNQIMYYYYQWSESILGKKLHINKLDYLGAFEERIHFFESLDYTELKEKARKQYLHALIWEYSRAKDILKNKEMVKKIVKKYRKYYKFGTYNNDFKNETKIYMFQFYVSPFFTDLMGKIKWRLNKRI